MKQLCTTTLLPFLCSVLSILPLAGCTESESPDEVLGCQVETVAGPEDDVTGKWKLIRQNTFRLYNGDIEVKDYSCDNIVYHFNPNGVVKIDNDVEGGGRHVTGEYVFELIRHAFDGKDYYVLKIGTLNWPCRIKESHMTLNMAHVDGPTLYFSRIE
ncbi:hypothetical protein LZF95_04970 [Algoriphagus sp. AGSA1]|uniref:hypothetical protein n=1 Tax=Algoriphagus sp. AGSA1 TaxID=2907213 RepID=UPI001F32B8AB|nr:hypothetical protein [Algoriphagus sp. AGSA1]MCE7054021.1 hypothetical protein [Algoriphagus sp. AGSA1]